MLHSSFTDFVNEPPLSNILWYWFCVQFSAKKPSDSLIEAKNFAGETGPTINAT